MGKRVLVADDSATIQRAFAMVFGGQQDISLIPARSLDEAVSAARQGRPDLVIADANLAGRTGYELCAAVKSDPGLRGVPVIILASSHAPFDDAKGREAGVDGHLSKPFESQALIDRVSEILARPVSISPPARAAADLPATAPQPVQARPPVASARPPAAVDDDEDDYGEFKIERPSGPSLVPPAVRPAAAPMAPPSLRPSLIPSHPPVSAPLAARPPAPVAAPGGLRPSLIPGARPGAPGRVPYAPVTTPPPVSVPAARAPSAPPATQATPLAAHGAGRTIMGLPAVAIPGVPPVRPTGPPASPVAPTPGMTTPSAPHAPSSTYAPAARPAPTAPMPLAPVPSNQQSAPELGSAFAQKIEAKVAAIAARGPEYEIVARMSREIIEQVVWEVVPELAEMIIREHVERLSARK